MLLAERRPGPNSLENSRGSQSLKKRCGSMSRGGRLTGGWFMQAPIRG
jgi:hypothetical protein